MKITIKKDSPHISDEERDLIRESAIPVESDPEEFKRHMLACKEVIIPEEIAKQIEAKGLTVDEVVSMLLKAAGAQQ